MKRPVSITALVIATSTAVPLSSAHAVKPPGVGEDEGAANNLSVPAIFVTTVGVGTPKCTDADDTVLPDPAEVDGPDDQFPGYWIQGEDFWQADCMTASADSVNVEAQWGDNLTNAPLKQRTPIRVEVGLLANSAPEMTGFVVEKLTPELLDRYATYGTNGEPVKPFVEVRVWNAGATLSIIRDSDGKVVYNGPFSAEINSTGRIVYGFNWQRPEAGEYTITFVRANAEGKFFRLRYRAIGEHHTEGTTEEDGCGDESWTRVPEHGWHPLRKLKVHLDLP